MDNQQPPLASPPPKFRGFEEALEAKDSILDAIALSAGMLGAVAQLCVDKGLFTEGELSKMQGELSKVVRDEVNKVLEPEIAKLRAMFSAAKGE